MVKIKNISDVITNSSSEVFLIKSDLPSSEVKKDLKKHDSGGASGMGGIVEVLGNGETGGSIYDTPEFLPEGYLLADIDEYKKGLIKYLLENYNVVDVSDSNLLVDSDGRVLDYIRWSEKKPGYIRGDKLFGIISDYEEYGLFKWSNKSLKRIYNGMEEDRESFPTFESFKIYMIKKKKESIENFKKVFGDDKSKKC